MPTTGSPAQSVLAELGFVLFARAKAGELPLSGKAPGWLAALWPALAGPDALLPIDEASPFLENFFIDAEECWGKGGDARATSGPWVERDSQGAELQLEATAMTVEGQSILLLERLGAAFEAKSRSCNARAKRSSRISDSIPKSKKRKSFSIAWPMK